MLKTAQSCFPLFTVKNNKTNGKRNTPKGQTNTVLPGAFRRKPRMLRIAVIILARLFSPVAGFTSAARSAGAILSIRVLK